MPILQDEIWRKTQKLLAAGRMRSTLFGYSIIFVCRKYSNIKNEEKDEKNHYLRRERSYGSFTRSFDLDGINSDEISASYKDGILTLTLPKATQKVEEGRRLEIQ